MMEFVLENEYLRATVTEWGAQIKSIVRKCDNVEHMWNGDQAVWKFHSPVMFPYAGKVKDGKIQARGQLLENCPQHGVARISTHSMVEYTGNKLVLALEDNEETRKIFPYSFRLLSTFCLEGDAMLHTLTVENTDTEAYGFGIGYHPAFAVPFDEQHTLQDYEFRFSDLESPLCLDTSTGLINGQYYRLDSNIRTIALQEGMFDDGSHCMTNLRSRTLGLYEKGTGRGVECTIEDFPYCLIWSTPEQPIRFVCIEPWHSLPSHSEDNYDWSRKAHAAVVSPGQRWSTTMRTAFVR